VFYAPAGKNGMKKPPFGGCFSMIGYSSGAVYPALV
jgi:hypothetical protein